MNAMKRILAMLMAIIMVMGCAFAEGDVLMIVQDAIEEHVHEEAPALLSEEEEIELADLGEVLFEEAPAMEPVEEEIIAEEPAEEPAAETEEEELQSVKLIQTNDEGDCAHKNSYFDGWYEYVNYNITEKTAEWHSGTCDRAEKWWCMDCGCIFDVLIAWEVQLNKDPHEWSSRWTYNPETGEEIEEYYCRACGEKNSCEHALEILEENRMYQDGTDNGNGTHNATYITEVYSRCTKCGVEIWYEDDTERVEENIPHNWGYDSETGESMCRVCPAVNSCKHDFSRTEDYREIQEETMKDNGDGTHSYKYYAEYINICSKCAAIYYDFDEENLLTEKGEKHDWDGDKCWHCGAVNTCTHKNKVAEYTNEYSSPLVHSKDANGHTITAYTETQYTCPDCGERFWVMSEKPTTVNETLPHEWWDGRCEICGYLNSCQHPKWVAEYVDYSTNDGLGSIVSYTATSHTLIGDKYDCGDCPDCGEYVRKLAERNVQFTEQHTYDDGENICWRCRYENTCEHANMVVSTDYWSYSEEEKYLNDNYHIRKLYGDKISACPECGYRVSKETGETITIWEEHFYNESGKCWVCDAKNPCKHTKTKEFTATDIVGVKDQGDKKGHTVNTCEVTVTYCTECGADVSVKKGKTSTDKQPHSFGADNVCRECDYVSTCAHKDRSTKKDSYTEYQVINESKHIKRTHKYNDVYCDSCDAYLVDYSSYNTTYSSEEKHSFSGDVCKTCGYAKEGASCKHTYENGICTKCGMTCVHDYKNCVCTECGDMNHTGLGLNDCYCEGCKQTLHDLVDNMCTRCGKRIVDIQKLEVVGLDEKGVLTIGTKLTHTLGWKMEPADALANLTFKSSNTKVAKVDASGVITGVAAGKATITITVDNYEVDIDPIKFTVKVDKAPTSVATQKAPSGGDLLCVGETLQLNATVKPAGVLHALTWTSSNEEVAKVDENGLVTGVGAGSAKITVKTQNGKKATYSLKVAAAPAGMNLGIADNVLLMGEKQTYQIKPVMLPEGAGSEVTYKAEGEAVTVTAAGKVTAKAAGSAQITVSTWGLADQIINVTVVKAPAKVSFNRTAITASLDEKTLQLKPVIADDEFAGYTWSSSNKKIATVDANGLVKFLKKGTVTITVKTHNGKSAKCKITIMPKAPTSMTAELGNAGLLVGETTALKLKFNKNEGSSDIKMSFVSGEGVVSYEDGVVTALKKGTAKLRFEAYNGVYAECDVTVSAELASIKIVDGVKLAENGASVGQKISLAVERIDADGNPMTAGTYKWTVSNKNATIDKNGVLTIKKAGDVTVTVEAYNGKTDTLSFKAVAAPKKVVLSAKKATIGVGETFVLTAGVDPEAPTTLTVKSSKASVAEVTEVAGGYAITAKKAGSATITVKTHNGKSAKCVVTVKKAPTGLKLSATEINMLNGDTAKLTASFNKNEGSSMMNVKVDPAGIVAYENGVVTALKTGTATVTFETLNNVTASCKVNVSAALKEIVLMKGEAEISYAELSGKQTMQLGVKRIDEEGKEMQVGDYTFKSSNTKLVTVSNTGKVTVKSPKDIAYVTITVTGYNGVKDEMTLFVCPAPTKVNLVNLETWTPAKKVTLTVGETFELYADVEPFLKDMDTPADLKVSSNKPTVAAVDAVEGQNRVYKITAVKAGTANITVKTHNGKIGKCVVTVKAAQ